MSKKLLFIDVETTGLDHKVYDIVEICLIVDINNEIKETLTLKMAPFNQVFEPEALRVNGRKWEEVLQFQDPKEAYKKIINLLEKYMEYEERGFYDKRDKFDIVAYNASFDVRHLSMFFLRNNDNRLQRFYNKVIDPFYQLDQYRTTCQQTGTSHPFKSLKLGRVCEYFGIDLPDAHSAEPDTLATRKLFYTLGLNYRENKFEKKFSDLKGYKE